MRAPATCIALLLCVAGALVPATAGAAAITEFQLPVPNSQPAGITAGEDGAVWFTEENGHKIGRITTGGTITEYQIPTVPSAPSEITWGPDDALWFTEQGAIPPKIGRLKVINGIPDWKEYPLPDFSFPDGITTGPDGALWFTENGLGRIGRMTTDGVITNEYDVAPGGFRPGDITTNPVDGRLWFTMSEAARIGAITTGGAPDDYVLPAFADPSGITATSGGVMWFTQGGRDVIGRLQVAGRQITEFGPTGRKPSGITQGPDGALWFTETEAHKIGRMTTTGRLTEFQIPTVPSAPGDIVTGPDGAMWFTEFDGNKIGRVEPGSATSTFVSAAPPAPLPLVGKRATPKKKKSACRVPKLRGLTVRKARKKLRRVGCRYRVRGKGRIVSVRPRPGTRTRSTVQVRAKRRAR